MRLLMTGVGGAFTTAHFNTGALIDAPDGYVLLDCGGMILRALSEATSKAGWPVEPLDINDIILTHLHGDHCNGLESFAFLRRIQRMDNPELRIPRLHTSPQVAARLWDRLSPSMDRPFGSDHPSELGDYLDLNVIEIGQDATVAGMAVQTMMTGHLLPTTALLLSDEQGMLGWSSDATFDEYLIDWLNQADVILHETSPGAAHTPIEKLHTLPDAIRAKMHLMHYPDDMDPNSTDMRLLMEGDVIEVCRS